MNNSIIIIVALVIIIILLLLVIFNIKYEGMNVFQIKTKQAFEKLNGETFDDTAQDVIKYGKLIPNPEPIDNFRIGTTLLLNAKDPVSAKEYFADLLNDIIDDNNVNMTLVPNILDNIQDFRNEYEELNNLPLQDALLSYYNKSKKEMQLLNEEFKDTPNKAVKILEAKKLQVYENKHNNSQSVHDSAVTIDIKEQFNKIQENNMNGKISKNDYEDCIKFIKNNVLKNNPDKVGGVNKYLDIVSQNNKVPTLDNNIREQEFLTTVWRRINDPVNVKNQAALKEALLHNILDCVNPDEKSVVCIDGRVGKIFTTFATLDADSSVGNIRSKDQIKQDIYSLASSILQQHKDKAPSIIAIDIETGVNSVGAKQLKETVCSEFEAKAKENYSKYLPVESLKTTIDLAKMAINE